MLLLLELPRELEKPGQPFPRVVYGVLAPLAVTRYQANKGSMVRQAWFMLDLFIAGLFRAFNMCFEVRITIFKRDSEYTV